MKKYTNFTKTNSSYRYGCYHVGRTDMWGNYCPETGEYYLACKNTDPTVGDFVEVLASAREMPDGEWEEQSACGYSYEVVRELLQLGHLTPKTLAQFLLEEGEVWWNQPNFHGSTDWGGTRLVLLEDAYGDNIFLGGKSRPCFAARAVNTDDSRIYKCIWLDTPPEGMPEYWYEDPDHYIDWDKCDDAIETPEYWYEDKEV